MTAPAPDRAPERRLRNLAGIEVTKAIATAGLKITPDIMVGGGGDGGGANVFAAFIAQLLATNSNALNPPRNGST